MGSSRLLGSKWEWSERLHCTSRVAPKAARASTVCAASILPIPRAASASSAVKIVGGAPGGAGGEGGGVPAANGPSKKSGMAANEAMVMVRSAVPKQQLARKQLKQKSGACARRLAFGSGRGERAKGEQSVSAQRTMQAPLVLGGGTRCGGVSWFCERASCAADASCAAAISCAAASAQAAMCGERLGESDRRVGVLEGHPKNVVGTSLAGINMSALLLGVAAASGAVLCAPSTMHRGLAAAPTMLRPHAASVRMAAPADDPSPLPPGAVLFDKAKHECYDYEAEAAAVERVVEVLTQLSGFGVEGAERRLWPSLRASCDALKDAMAESAAPLPINDPRLLGDWELVGTTSASFAMRGGLSGLGRAPFTGPEAIFVTFEGSGEVTAREVLKFFGRPVVLNELRGRFGFDDKGLRIQEQYFTGDVGGQKDNPQWQGATTTQKDVLITADGMVRIGQADDGASDAGWFVYKKLEPGMMQGYLTEKKLPLKGGTTVGNVGGG